MRPLAISKWIFSAFGAQLMNAKRLERRREWAAPLPRDLAAEEDTVVDCGGIPPFDGPGRAHNPAGDPVVTRLWLRRFASDPEGIGKSISLRGDPQVVIGILGSSFNVEEFGTAPEVWLFPGLPQNAGMNRCYTPRGPSPPDI